MLSVMYRWRASRNTEATIDVFNKSGFLNRNVYLMQCCLWSYVACGAMWIVELCGLWSNVSDVKADVKPCQSA